MAVTKGKGSGTKKAGGRGKKHNFFFCAGAALSGFMCALIVLGFFWTPYGTTKMNAAEKMQAPSLRHLLGTDNFGRDVLSRVMEGAGQSALIALCAVAIGCAIGILIGSLCGYFGGIPDLVLMRLCDIVTAFPSILLALVVVSITGGGVYNIILVLGILFVPSFARVVRTEYARCREQNYIRAARLMGVSAPRILYAHILPNTMTVLLPAVTIGFNNAILSEASMSFLGIGIQPPAASLGLMLRDSQTYLRNAPWYALGSGGAMVLLILGFSLLSESFQADAE